jgi:hypothetical protein
MGAGPDSTRAEWPSLLAAAFVIRFSQADIRFVQVNGIECPIDLLLN